LTLINLPAITISQDLPTFHFKAGHSTFDRSLAGEVIRFDKTGTIDWGILHIEGEEGEWHRTEGWIEVRKNVVITRGKEKITGEAVHLDMTRGVFVVTRGQLQFERFTIAGERLARDLKTGSITGQQVRLLAPRAGRYDLGIRAQEIALDEDGLLLKDTQIGLFGHPLVSLHRYTGPVPSRDTINNNPTGIPLVVRFSQIAGMAYGLHRTATINPHTRFGFLFEEATKVGIEQSYSLRHDLSYLLPKRPQQRPQQRRQHVAESQAPTLVPASGEPDTQGDTLRLLLTEPPTPPKADPVQSFTSILRTQQLIGRRQVGTAQYLAAEVRHDERFEFGERRAGNILLSRRPEATLSAGRPIGSAQLNLQLQSGDYAETHLFSDASGNRGGTQAQRDGARLEIDTNSKYLTHNLLLHPRLSQTWYRYNTGQSFRILEGAVATEWVLGEQTGASVALIERKTQGSTPLIFDQLDATSEGQTRLQWQKGRITLANATRWDVKQRKLFDYEWGIVYNGAVFAPRLSYRRQTGQIGLSLSLNPKLFSSLQPSPRR
jgi:hypothetical protein